MEEMPKAERGNIKVRKTERRESMKVLIKGFWRTENRKLFKTWEFVFKNEKKGKEKK